MPHLHNKTNEYSDALGDLLDRIPKTVFAAIAFSYASCGGDDFAAGVTNIIREWWILYENGIVPQKPPMPKPADEPLQFNPPSGGSW